MYPHIIWIRLLICCYMCKNGRKAIPITPNLNVVGKHSQRHRASVQEVTMWTEESDIPCQHSSPPLILSLPIAQRNIDHWLALLNVFSARAF